MSDYTKLDGWKGTWLSNMHPVSVEYGGVIYPSVENAYQAAKTLDINARKEFEWMTPYGAKSAGKKLIIRPDWEEVKIPIMLDLVTQKYKWPRLRKRLLDTNDHELIEWNSHGDDFWGQITYKADINSLHGGVLVGSNHLGKITEIVRSNLRNEIQIKS